MNFYKIADINFSVQGSDFDYFNNVLKSYAAEGNEETDTYIIFNLCENIDVDGIKHFASEYGRYYFCDKEYHGFYDHIDEADKTVTLMKADKNYKNLIYNYCDLADLFGIKSDTGITNVFGNLFRDIILNYQGIVIHASTIMYDGCAVTFTAPSGTGKSTHTALWKKYYPETVIINDDSPAIKLKDDKFYAYGTPWSGKADINVNTSAPLKAMVFIERSDKCSIHEISTQEAFIRMIKELPTTHFKHQSDLMMGILNRLFCDVPSYLLKCDISKDAVDIVKNKLFI